MNGRDGFKAEVRRQVAATLMQGAARRPLELAVAAIHRALREQGRWESPNGQWRMLVDGHTLITQRSAGSGWETVMTGLVPGPEPARQHDEKPL